jgi:hypothetical protein
MTDCPREKDTVGLPKSEHDLVGDSLTSVKSSAGRDVTFEDIRPDIPAGLGIDEQYRCPNPIL